MDWINFYNCFYYVCAAYKLDMTKGIIEEEVDAISREIHELRTEYVKKLQVIEKKGKFLSFKNVDELRNSIESSEQAAEK
ncbi:Uncharacterised protein [uncultured archaeon]|nr:Uncharacterised protein [uncultured archaeon]